MKKINIYLVIMIAVVLIALTGYGVSLYIAGLRDKIGLLEKNQSTLLDSVHHYLVQDSLNTSKVSALTLSLKEYKRYRAEDQALIKKLKADKPVSTITTNTETVTHIKTELKDSIIYLDTLKTIDYHSRWTDVKGFIKADSAILTINNREELLIHESVRRKKFLFFKLPVKLFGYKSQEIDVLSKNPNTHIEHIEWIKYKQ